MTNDAKSSKPAPNSPAKNPGSPAPATTPKPVRERGQNLEVPGQNGMETEPNRHKATGPGGQRMVNTERGTTADDLRQNDDQEGRNTGQRRSTDDGAAPRSDNRRK